MLAAWGWNVEHRFIGRRLWLSARHPGKNWILGSSLFGTVGVAGSVEIHLQRIGGDRILRDEIDLEVYLK